jgi:hypothetical protein
LTAVTKLKAERNRKTLKKETNFSWTDNLLQDRLYLSIQKTPNPEELVSILSQ